MQNVAPHNLYDDVIAGQLSDESTNWLLEQLQEHLITGDPIALPSRSHYLLKRRNDALEAAYQMMNCPSITEFYNALMDSYRAGSNASEHELILLSVHRLCEKYNIQLPSRRQLGNILTPSGNIPD